jgi:hypothetical protein
MKKRITLTIDDVLYDALEELPRKVSVSEVANLLLTCYVEMFKKGGRLTDSDLDAIIENAGGQEFLQRFKTTLKPFFDKLGHAETLEKISNLAVKPDKKKSK